MTDPNALASRVDRWRLVVQALRDERQRLAEQLPRYDVDATVASTQRDALTRYIGDRSATPEVGAALRAQYAVDFDGFAERIAEPARVRARLGELPDKITEAQRALAKAEREAGTGPGSDDALRAWGVGR